MEVEVVWHKRDAFSRVLDEVRLCLEWGSSQSLNLSEFCLCEMWLMQTPVCGVLEFSGESSDENHHRNLNEPLLMKTEYYKSQDIA